MIECARRMAPGAVMWRRPSARRWALRVPPSRVGGVGLPPASQPGYRDAPRLLIAVNCHPPGGSRAQRATHSETGDVAQKLTCRCNVAMSVFLDEAVPPLGDGNL
ncbi:unnamed protein product [Boreogadus saida]